MRKSRRKRGKRGKVVNFLAQLKITWIDEILTKLAEEQNFFAPGTEPKRVVGLLSKAFFAQVDKSLVDSKLVQERARGILEARQ